MTGREVIQYYNILCDLYPYESFGSRSSVFIAGWKDHVITREEFEAARNFYGTLWNYTGD